MRTNNNDNNGKHDKKFFSESSIEFSLSLKLNNLIQKRNPTFKKQNLQKWSQHIDSLIKIDKRQATEIEKVIEWCQQDSFWQNTILSTSGLRKNYDQLKMKMDKNKSPEQTNNDGFYSQ